MGCFLFLIFGAFISTTSGVVDIIYLKGVPRLGNSDYWDYYFSCSAIGSSQELRVNNILLVTFVQENTAEVKSNSTSNFDYTTTLLSSMRTPHSQSTFDSLLIVSCRRQMFLRVVCTNGSRSNSTDNSRNKSGVQNQTSNSYIYLEHILSQRNLNRVLINTTIFICGINNAFMEWHVNSKSFGFTTQENIGTEKRDFQQYTVSTVRHQAILIGREPYSLVTVLLVIDNSEVNVDCGFSQNFLELSSRRNIPLTTLIPEEMTMITKSSTDGEDTQLPQEGSLTSAEIGLIIALVVVVPVLVITLTGIFWCGNRFIVRSRQSTETRWCECIFGRVTSKDLNKDMSSKADIEIVKNSIDRVQNGTENQLIPNQINQPADQDNNQNHIGEQHDDQEIEVHQ